MTTKRYAQDAAGRRATSCAVISCERRGRHRHGDKLYCVVHLNDVAPEQAQEIRRRQRERPSSAKMRTTIVSDVDHCFYCRVAVAGAARQNHR